MVDGAWVCIFTRAALGRWHRKALAWEAWGYFTQFLMVEKLVSYTPLSFRLVKWDATPYSEKKS